LREIELMIFSEGAFYKGYIDLDSYGIVCSITILKELYQELDHEISFIHFPYSYTFKNPVCPKALKGRITKLFYGQICHFIST
jgi:hypothetical protein